MKKVFKILLYIFGGFGLLVSLAIVAIFFFTADIVGEADSFFTAVREDDISRARSHLSEDFKIGMSETALAKFMTANALDDVVDVSWEERARKIGWGYLVGEVTTGNGRILPVTLGFVKRAEDWRIYAIVKTEADLGADTETSTALSEARQIKLVAETMDIFAAAINKRSMVDFHGYVADILQRQTTPEKLDEIFAGFYDAGIDLTLLDGMVPQFDGPGSLDENGIFLITGHYPTRPSQVIFELSYIYETQGWKLVKISVDVEPME